MYWNYRIIETTYQNGEKERAIHEVYYNDNGKLDAYCEQPSSIVWSNFDNDNEEGLDTISHLMEAFNKPILTLEDFK